MSTVCMHRNDEPARSSWSSGAVSASHSYAQSAEDEPGGNKTISYMVGRQLCWTWEWTVTAHSAHWHRAVLLGSGAPPLEADAVEAHTFDDG